jgi:hypothetical protein
MRAPVLPTLPGVHDRQRSFVHYSLAVALPSTQQTPVERSNPECATKQLHFTFQRARECFTDKNNGCGRSERSFIDFLLVRLM